MLNGFFFQDDSNEENSSMNLNYSLNDTENFNSAFNLVFNNNIEEGNSDIEIKKPLFSTEVFGKKKRGRYAKNKSKRREHNKMTEDNVITKIQTHFMSFIIKFINDCINLKGQKNKFKKFNHKIKSNISKRHIKKLKDSSIKDLLKNIPISTKYKNHNEFINKNLVDKLSKDSFFKGLFNMRYLDLFNYYYNNNRPLKEISINNKIIKLSPKTETFYELIEKHKDYKERILEVTEKIYINEIY